MSNSVFNNFYYNKQIKRYLTQFMCIFSEMQCLVGKDPNNNNTPTLIKVPVAHGQKDRVVAWIKSAQTQNQLMRLPTMSVHITDIQMAPERRKGVGVERRETFLPNGGVFPDDLQVVHQLMPAPYKMTCQLSIYTSNLEQRFQILEQIMMFFDPILQIQTSDTLFDWTKITTVELTGLSNEDNYPSGNDRRMLIQNLTFDIPIYISGPANIKTDFIKKILLRIGAVDSLSEDITVSEALDAQGIQYTTIFDLKDLDIDEPPAE